MMKIDRWNDDYGDDPVDRTTTARPPGPGTVTVTHVPPIVPPWNPGYPPYTPGDDEIELNDVASNNPVSVNTFTIAPEVPAKVISQQSGMAPFETLFNELEFEAIPSYNFWEKDEETTVRDRANLDPSELPRYIKLAWTMAPDLKDPAEFQKRRMMGYMPDARTVRIELSPFGFGANAVVGTLIEGMPFTPPHLQPSNFEQNARQISNGYIFTGMIPSIITMKTDNITTPKMPTPILIDEDDYLLNHNTTWGIPYNEMNAALWRRKSTVYGLQQTIRPGPIQSSIDMKRGLFNGQFGVSSGRRTTAITAENPSSPSISTVARNAISSPFGSLTRGNNLYAISQYDPEDFDYSSDSQEVKANFIHTNFAGAMDAARVNTITTADQAESIIALAPLAGNLAVYAAAGVQHYGREISIPSFNAPAILKPLEYIGYVIEKYEQKAGSYQLVDTIFIPGREFDSYIDAKVKYGVSYRYRIRSILRWCRPQGVGVLGSDLMMLHNMRANLATLTPNSVSYFGSEWSKKWAYALLIDKSPPAPPDEFAVRPHSAGDERGPFIEVTMKLPYNPQQDISKMILYRKLQDQDGIDLTGWVQIQEFSAAERQGTRHLFITKFEHDQDDITGMKFDVSEVEKTETFVEFAPTNSRYKDYDVKFYGDGVTYRYVYAGQTVTRHGEQSTLSDQLGARLNPEWKKHGETSIDFVSCAGVDKDFDVGIFGTYPEKRLRSEVIFRPDFKNQVPGAVGLRAQERVAQRMLSNTNYIMRVESLDNGQSFDIPVTVNVTTLPEVVTRLPYVPFSLGLRTDAGGSGQTAARGGAVHSVRWYNRHTGNAY